MSSISLPILTCPVSRVKICLGKTSVAAATALRSARLRYRTIILSTDSAHSLSDSFDLALRSLLDTAIERAEEAEKTKAKKRTKIEVQ